MSKYVVYDVECFGFVFVEEHPREQGYDVPAIESKLESQGTSDNIYVHFPCLGRHPDGESAFKVFRTERECRSGGYVPTARSYICYPTWADYLRKR